MRHIGFSSGVLHKIHNPYTKENIEILKNCGSNAIEVNYHHTQDFDSINKVVPFIQNFDYVSIHAPVDTRYGNDEQTDDLLKKIVLYYQQLQAKLVVIHPDLVDNWDVFNKYKINWAVENMDSRKKTFKDVASLETFFTAHPSWGMVLDVGHCNDHDKSMMLAQNFIAKFKNKIKEIHLSGYKVFHDPLHKTEQTEIIDYCKLLDAPIIIESVFELSDGTEGVKKEFDYILKNLK